MNEMPATFQPGTTFINNSNNTSLLKPANAQNYKNGKNKNYEGDNYKKSQNFEKGYEISPQNEFLQPNSPEINLNGKIDSERGDELSELNNINESLNKAQDKNKQKSKIAKESKSMGLTGTEYLKIYKSKSKF